MDLVFSSSITLSSLAGIFYLRGILNKKSQFMQYLESMPVLSPSELIKSLQSGQEDVLKFFQEHGQLLKGEIFLEGILDSPSPIKSYFDQTVLIVSRIFRKNLYTEVENAQKQFTNVLISDSQYKLKNYNLVQSSSAPYFQLSDWTKPQISCPVQKNINVEILESFNFMYLSNKKMKINWFQILMTLVKYVIKRLLIKDKDEYTQVGCKQGEQTLELGIAPKSHIVVWGKVIYDKATQTLSVKEPKIFTSDKQFILNYFNSKQIFHKILLFILILIFSYGSILTIKIIYAKIKNWIIQQKNQKKDPLYKIDDIKLDDMRCILCIEQVRNVIFKPCKHMIVCYDCCKKIIPQKCPMCKTPIKSLIEIYVS